MKTLKEIANLDDATLEELAAHGRALYEQKDHSSARSIFRGLANIDPDNLDHYRMYAAASVADGDANAALSALDMALRYLKVVEAEPAYLAEILAFKATILIKAGKKRDAHRIAEEALAMGPADATWRPDLEKGVADLASSLKPLLQRKPHADVSDVVADRIEEAAEEGRSLAWVFGYKDDELLELHKEAVQLTRAGNLESARRILDGLVALDGSIPLFHSSLGTVCELLGDPSAARDAFQRAVEVAQGVPDGDDLVESSKALQAAFQERLGDNEVL